MHFPSITHLIVLWSLPVNVLRVIVRLSLRVNSFFCEDQISVVMMFYMSLYKECSQAILFYSMQANPSRVSVLVLEGSYTKRKGLDKR